MKSSTGPSHMRTWTNRRNRMFHKAANTSKLTPFTSNSNLMYTKEEFLYHKLTYQLHMGEECSLIPTQTRKTYNTLTCFDKPGPLSRKTNPETHPVLSTTWPRVATATCRLVIEAPSRSASTIGFIKSVM